MRIAHELEDVRILRTGRTIVDGLETLYGKGRYARGQRTDLVSSLMSGERKLAEPLPDELYKTLVRVHEGDLVYTRTCALVTLEREWTTKEFYSVLDDRGYVPAGTSETIAFVLAYKNRGVVVHGRLDHLGTRILDELYNEKRLVTGEDGKVELVPFYSTTKLKTYHRLVVVQKPKKAAATSVVFGRKK